MNIISIPAAVLAFTAQSGAVVLTTLPTPMNQGGMIHINVAFNAPSSAITINPDPGTPVIKPLSEWKPGDTLEAASPWYATLDPTQAAGLFNSQFGLLLFDSDPLPASSKIMVGWVSGTPGLEAYQWRNTEPQVFTGILGTDGSSSSWDWSSVAHGMMHPMFVMPSGSGGTASVTLSFTMSDLDGNPLPGYTPAQTTLNFSVIPEPSAVLISSLAGLLLIRRKRINPTQP
jgi:hypothetical protein